MSEKESLRMYGHSDERSEEESPHGYRHHKSIPLLSIYVPYSFFTVVPGINRHSELFYFKALVMRNNILSLFPYDVEFILRMMKSISVKHNQPSIHLNSSNQATSKFFYFSGYYLILCIAKDIKRHFSSCKSLNYNTHVLQTPTPHASDVAGKSFFHYYYRIRSVYANYLSSITQPIYGQCGY